MNEIVVHFQSQDCRIDSEFLARLESMANEFGISIDEQTRQTIAHSRLKRQRRLDDFIREADDFARRTGPQSIDSADLIREDRDRL